MSPVPPAASSPTGAGFIARPLLPLTAALIAGIAAADRFPALGSWAAAVAAAAAGALLFNFRRRRASVLWPAVLFLALGGMLLEPWQPQALPEGHVLAQAADARCRISGRVADRPQPAFGRLRLVLAVDTVDRPDGPSVTHGKVRLTIAGTGRQFDVGDRIAVTGRVRPVRSFRNPGGFDYRRYLRFQAIHATCWAREQEVELLQEAPPFGPAAAVDRLRTRIAARIDAAVDPRTRGVLKALIVGDRSDVTPELRAAFNRIGAGHLLAISGLHVGMVAAAAFFVWVKLWSRSPAMLRRAWTRKAAALCTLLPVLAYGLLAGMSPATRRAVIMAAVFLLAIPAEHEHDPLNTLALAALLILSLHPPALFSIGFQLSFAAAGSILYGLECATRGPGRPSGPRPSLARAAGRWLWGLVLVSALAMGGTLPLVMRCFNQVSLVGLPANVLLVPLVGGLVLPLGLIGALASFLVPPLGGLLLAASGQLLVPAVGLAQWAAQWPAAAVKTVTPSTIEIAAYYVAAGGLLTLARGADGTAAGTKPPGRRRSAALAAAAAAALVLVLDATWWAGQRFGGRELRFTALDVGHGSCCVLELPRGRVMLVDGGGFSDNRIFDVGARVVAPFLWGRKILTVDTVVLSHPDSDHLNGLHYICRHFNVRQVWTNGQPARSGSYREFLRLLAEGGIDAPRFSGLPRHRRVGGAEIEILHPPPVFAERLGTRPWRDANDHSLVVRVAYGPASFLLPGDITAAAERRIAARHAGRLASTVLMAPHHGSASSSTPGFVRQVRPKLVVVSSGAGGRFRLPHPRVELRYLRGGARVLRTNRDGAVEIVCDRGGLRVIPTEGEDWSLAARFCRIDRDAL